MSERRHLEPVEDFTTPFLWSFLVVIFMGLFAIWTIWGIIAAALTGWVVDRCITVGERSAIARRKR